MGKAVREVVLDVNQHCRYREVPGFILWSGHIVDPPSSQKITGTKVELSASFIQVGGGGPFVANGFEIDNAHGYTLPTIWNLGRAGAEW